MIKNKQNLIHKAILKNNSILIDYLRQYEYVRLKKIIPIQKKKQLFNKIIILFEYFLQKGYVKSFDDGYMQERRNFI